jgi:hypothetical protein
MRHAAGSANQGGPTKLSPGLLLFRLRGAADRAAKASASPGRNASGPVMFTERDVQRIETLSMMREGRITPAEAQLLLNVSRSQLYKIRASFIREGKSGIASGARGKPSNRSYCPEMRKTVLQLIAENYHDYGPTLLAEVLGDFHGISLSAETIRQWMLADGLWIKNRAARKRLHQPRKRLAHYGELVQMDGSEHDWFEDRGPRCTLMVMIDDATGRLQHIHFCPRENRDAYFRATHAYISAHGRPARIQTDRHSSVWSDDGPSEFTNALQERLTIIHSFAYTPQSKGRVERANRTLQDRLVKALRREGISTIEQANAFAPNFLVSHNERFAREPLQAGDSHRHVDRHKLESAFSERHIRQVSKQLTFSFGAHEYVIKGAWHDREKIGAKVTIEIWLDGTMFVLGREGPLTFRRC